MENPCINCKEFWAISNKTSCMDICMKYQEYKGLEKPITKNRYEKSEKLLRKITKVIPLGAGTYSKSYLQFPYGSSPFYADHAEGAYLYDVDGNKYIDMIGQLCPNILGYCDKDINNAIRYQLDLGTNFSLPTTLNYTLAEMIKEFIPCAEMVKFGMNGSDATEAAVRVARAYTNRDHIARFGYNGSHDVLLANSLKNWGIPTAVGDLIHNFEYNNLDSLRKIFDDYPGQIACVIMEPMQYEYPDPGFLQNVKSLAHINGSLLIFDEVITFLRFPSGSAQAYFNVTPDLCTLGKSLANGNPLSAIVGKKEYMKLFECQPDGNSVMFSNTFNDYCLSMAAGMATLKKVIYGNVLLANEENGTYLKESIENIINELSIEYIQIKGIPTWHSLTFKDYNEYTANEIKALWQQEIYKNGLLSIGYNVVSYAMDKDIIDKAISIYKKVFEYMDTIIKNNSLHKVLKCKPLNTIKLR